MSSHNQAGKGDKPRPMAVDRRTYEANWRRAFGPPRRPGRKMNKQEARNYVFKTYRETMILLASH